MPNPTVNVELTPEEALIIATIRAMSPQNNVVKTDVQMGDELMQKYMAMNDNEFIDKYTEAVGDDVILSVLQDTLTYEQKSKAVLSSLVQTPNRKDIMQIDDYDELVEELFEAYVSNVHRRELFFQTQDRLELCNQLVDLKMDGR